MIVIIKKRKLQPGVVILQRPIAARFQGVERFAAEASRVGIDAVLTVDLPVNELAELATPLAAHQIAVVPLLAPTSTPVRFAKAAAFAPPFIYYISMTGVTGGAVASGDAQAERVAKTGAIRAATGVPVAVGFGIRTPADAAAVAQYADGVIVGTAIVDAIAAGPSATAAPRVGAYIATLRTAVARQPASR